MLLPDGVSLEGKTRRLTDAGTQERLPVLFGLILPALENKKLSRTPCSRPRAELRGSSGPWHQLPYLRGAGQPVLQESHDLDSDIERCHSGWEDIKPPSPVMFMGTDSNCFSSGSQETTSRASRRAWPFCRTLSPKEHLGRKTGYAWLPPPHLGVRCISQ